jgi:hypothetical protein
MAAITIPNYRRQIENQASDGAEGRSRDETVSLQGVMTLSPGQTDRQYYEQYWSRAERKTKRGK